VRLLSCLVLVAGCQRAAAPIDAGVVAAPELHGEWSVVRDARLEAQVAKLAGARPEIAAPTAGPSVPRSQTSTAVILEAVVSTRLVAGPDGIRLFTGRGQTEQPLRVVGKDAGGILLAPPLSEGPTLRARREGERLVLSRPDGSDALSFAPK